MLFPPAMLSWAMARNADSVSSSANAAPWSVGTYLVEGVVITKRRGC